MKKYRINLLHYLYDIKTICKHVLINISSTQDKKVCFIIYLHFMQFSTVLSHKKLIKNYFWCNLVLPLHAYKNARNILINSTFVGDQLFSSIKALFYILCAFNSKNMFYRFNRITPILLSNKAKKFIYE